MDSTKAPLLKGNAKIIEKNRPPDESPIDPKIQLRRNSGGYHVELSPNKIMKNKCSVRKKTSNDNIDNKVVLSPLEELNNNSGISSITCNTDSTLGELQIAQKTTFKQSVPSEIKTYNGYYFDILKQRVEQLESTLVQEGCTKPDDPSPNSLCVLKSYSTTSKKDSIKTTTNTTSIDSENNHISNNRLNMVLLQPFHHENIDSVSLTTDTYSSSFYRKQHPIKHSMDDVVRYQLYDNPVPLLDLPNSDSLTVDISDIKKYKDHQLEKRTYTNEKTKEQNELVDIENQIINDYLNYTASFRRTAPYIYREPNTITKKESPASSTIYNQFVSRGWLFPLKKRIAPCDDVYNKRNSDHLLGEKQIISHYANGKSRKPIFTFVTALIMIAYFIAELVKNSQYTGKAIQLSPFNVMVGPSAETMIHMGARYAPCMKSTLLYPTTKNFYKCPSENTQPSHVTPPLFNDQRSFFEQSPFNITCPLSSCSLQELCGGTNFKQPNQGYRFITSLFMHSGVVQLLINLGIHIRVGMVVERVINTYRYGIVWLASGIFGYIFGSLFSPQGNVILGCSVCLVGVVGYLLADTILNWRDIKMPIEILLKLILCSAISLLVGLLPGYDNSSHIGALLGGLIIAICLLPFSLKTSPTKSQYQAWLIGSMGYLLLAVLLWIFLRLFFAPNTSYCSWCRYFACLPISDLCRPYFTHVA